MANDSDLSSDPQNETTGDAITEYQSSSSHGVRANYELLADERISRRPWPETSYHGAASDAANDHLTNAEDTIPLWLSFLFTPKTPSGIQTTEEQTTIIPPSHF